MKRLILLLILVTAITGWSQEIKFNMGPPVTTESQFIRFQFTNLPETKAYLVSGFLEPKVLPLEEYTNPKTAIPLPSQLSGREGNCIILHAISVDGRNRIIYSTYDKKKKSETVYFQELSSAMKFIGGPAKISTFEDVKRPDQLEMILEEGGERTTTIAASLDKREFVLIKERDTAIELKGFNLDKGEKWSKTFSLDGGKHFVLRSIRVATNGNVYIVGSYYKKEEFFSPFVLAYSNAENKFKLHNIATGEKLEDTGYTLAFGRDEAPIVAGIYYKKLKRETGYNLFRINVSTLELEPILSKAFSPSFTELMYKRAYEPEFFSVQQIVHLPNGNIALSVEGGLSKVGQHTASTYYSSAYVLCVSDSGTEVWNTTIEKHQVQPTAVSLLGHILFNKGNKLYMLYNDNPDNYSLEPTSMPKENLLKNKSYVALISFDEKGKATKSKPLNQNAKQVTAFYPSKAFRIDANTLHFSLKVNDKYHFATVAVND